MDCIALVLKSDDDDVVVVCFRGGDDCHHVPIEFSRPTFPACQTVIGQRLPTTTIASMRYVPGKSPIEAFRSSSCFARLKR
jgi:hypothetical protein